MDWKKRALSAESRVKELEERVAELIKQCSENYWAGQRTEAQRIARRITGMYP